MVIIVVAVIVVCNGNHITELLVTIITECDKLGRRGNNDSSSGGCNRSRCNRVDVVTVVGQGLEVMWT